MGKSSKQWFYDTVSASEATFKVLITSSPILGPDRKNKNDNLINAGYSFEQADSGYKKQKNLFIVNGDRHWQYVTNVKNTNL